mgnify:CR=1 FL=1
MTKLNATGQRAIMQEIGSRVLAFFGGDQTKTTAWWTTPNPSLGGITPVDMCNAGKADKLLKWVKQQLMDNV